MKRIVALALLMSLVFVSLYAKKAKDLDPATITDPVPLANITIIVPTDIDTDGNGQSFIKEQFPGFIDTIASEVKKQINISIDTNEFDEAVANDSVIVESEKIDLGGRMKLNQYTWSAKDQPALRAYFSLPFVILDDGTMPLSVTIHQEGEKKKDTKSLTITVSLTPVPKESE